MQSITEFEIVRSNQTEPITFYVRDTLTGDLIDVSGTSTFSLINISDDSLQDSGSFTGSGGTKIIKVSTGIYQYSFNAIVYPENYLFTASCTLSNEVIRNNIYVKSVSARNFAYASMLRLQVDKSRKSMKDEIENMDRVTKEPSIQFFFGYDDKHLIFYLERGLQFLNAIPPYTSFVVDTFPFTQYGSILIDAGTIAALESQGVFAIDTDYNYSYGGNSLVIDHFSKLSTAVTSILNRFQKSALSWKQLYRHPGAVLYQFMPGGVRAMRQLNAMPAGFWSRLLSAAYQ